MPTYQYRCAKCGEQFEAWQSIHDVALTVHDGACGGALQKVFGVGGIVLKGPGFYRTDSRSQSRGKGKKAGEGHSSDAASGNGAGDKTGSGKSDQSGKSEKKDAKPAATASKSKSSTT